ncbi:lycopene cyclase family protein [Actinokineospora guangxiensis]|uniref:Lycopene cyclase family protein n=1 Tax=Actinokineospora guangxiensis TaxID=1490288 RepID=A0ABW0EKX9_9PSEU
MEAYDAVIAGGGPAGWALAAACARRGLATALVAPRPDAPWPATYGLWADQAVGLPAVVAASEVRAAGRVLERGYRVLDNAATLAAWMSCGVEAVRGSAVRGWVGGGVSAVRLDTGRELRARVVVDATGHHRRLSGGVRPATRVEQTAAGVILPADAAAAFAPPGGAVFMDGWDTADGVATFLYVVPLPGGRTLVEETSLAARPGIALGLLRERLARRLDRAGIDARDAAVEHVRFPMDVPVRGRGPAVPFGAAAGMVHPATGYSVGDALAAAPAVAEAIEHGPAAARSAIWPPAARAVHALRAHGRRVLLSLPPAEVPEFFELFFALPAHQQRAFLSGRTDVAGTSAAMAALFAAAPWRLRRRLAILRQPPMNSS